MEHSGWNSNYGTEHETRRVALPLWNGTWNTADGTPIVKRNMEHGRRNSHCGTEHGTRWMELPLWNGTWNMAGGTPIQEQNIENGGRNSHCGTEHGTNTADGTLIEEWNMEHTRLMELSLWNGTWKTADRKPMVERNMEHGEWNSHCRTEHGTRRKQLS